STTLECTAFSVPIRFEGCRPPNMDMVRNILLIYLLLLSFWRHSSSKIVRFSYARCGRLYDGSRNGLNKLCVCTRTDIAIAVALLEWISRLKRLAFGTKVINQGGDQMRTIKFRIGLGLAALC